jgi:hypothetical protein
MKLHLTALAAALPLAFAASGAHAAQPITWTGEIGYTHTSLDSDVKADFNTIDVRGGVQYGKHWGVEMEVGTGLGSDNTSYQGTSFSVKENYEVGVFAVGYLPLAKGLDLFGRFGGVGAQFHEEVLGGHGSNNEHGWAAGGGLRWFPGAGKNGVRLEYTRYGLNDDADNFGVSYVRKF